MLFIDELCMEVPQWVFEVNRRSLSTDTSYDGSILWSRGSEKADPLAFHTYQDRDRYCTVTKATNPRSRSYKILKIL